MSNNKHILVTGSNGFIGKRLVLALRNKGYTVSEFDRNMGDISMYRFDYADIDHIVHLASLIFVPASWEDPKSFYQTNVIGTINILELCRKVKCSLTYISSYVYGTPQYLPVDEFHPIHPASPYNHSKLLAEEACWFYSENFDIPVTIFRPVNVYGPGQNADFLIPKIIRQVFDPSVREIEVMDLRPKRDYLYINDFLQAIIRSIGQSNFEIYNIGSGRSHSVEEIIKTVCQLSGTDKAYYAKNKVRPHEILDVYADISKIKNKLGWEPTITFEKGLFECIMAYKMRD